MGSIGLSVATDSVRVVKQVVKLRVLPTAAHAAALEETLRTCNAAASWLSAQMHAGRAFRKIDAQHRFYRELRARFGLAAQPAIRVIGKVAECYAGLHANLAAGNYGPPGSDRRRRIEESPIALRSSAAQPFDARCLSWQFPDEMGRTATMSQRATLHTWAFAQLGSFLAYKARQAGVAFILVDPAYTSQTCSACGWVDKKNRRTQAVFECGRCGFVGHADHNAAINIAVRGAERWGEVMRPNAAPTLAAS
jgi:predicted RNA-binding Zn-ribbon protein involved in translation (DUF1610 family)